MTHPPTTPDKEALTALLCRFDTLKQMHKSSPTAWGMLLDDLQAYVLTQRREAAEAAETIGRVKELEAGDILPDFAFEHGCEWYIQGVKVPKYLARKISDAAKERRAKLLAPLPNQENKEEVV